MPVGMNVSVSVCTHTEKIRPKLTCWQGLSHFLVFCTRVFCTRVSCTRVSEPTVLGGAGPHLQSGERAVGTLGMRRPKVTRSALWSGHAPHCLVCTPPLPTLRPVASTQHTGAPGGRCVDPGATEPQ
ncbi:hypothetical protein HJG60_010744 [Phyllostomus discolor]|uniref:Uncharacterized protein n=1 Tax=Phyllostomus discolor TaxID=89673 RepID=A0A834AEE2_9CHIR|nr:hypothetical protein HJG60_010744 [Phyllostomus discolor]